MLEKKDDLSSWDRCLMTEDCVLSDRLTQKKCFLDYPFGVQPETKEGIIKLFHLTNPNSTPKIHLMPSHNKLTSMVEKYMLKWSDTEKVYRLVKDRILHHQIGYVGVT